MSTTFVVKYGKSSVYDANPSPAIPLLQLSAVVLAFDATRYYTLYADLLTRPVPGRLVGGHDHRGRPRARVARPRGRA